MERSNTATQLNRAVRLIAIVAFFALWRTAAFAVSSSIPQGVWLIKSEAAIQIFDCSNLLCGRVLWLQIPRDRLGQLHRDRNNPNPALRQRLVCGLTILWGLHSTGPDQWGGGWFYNPDDGKTYRASAHLRSPDALVARLYLGIPLVGRTKVLHRVAHGTSKGWC
jgi:uncharacterized protein (DUF2147 family)